MVGPLGSWGHGVGGVLMGLGTVLVYWDLELLVGVAGGRQGILGDVKQFRTGWTTVRTDSRGGG